MISDKLMTKGKPHEFFPGKTQTITSKGIDTKDLITGDAFPAIKYGLMRSEEVLKNSKNYITDLKFPIITCNNDGSLTSSYKDKETGEEKTSHGFTEVNLHVNLATMSDLYPALAEHSEELGGTIEDMFAAERSAVSKSPFMPVTANVNPNGKTTFDIDTRTLASEMAKQYNKSIVKYGLRSKDEDLDKARLAVTMNDVKVTVDGVGKVTPESLNKGLVQAATTAFIASNSETLVADNKKQGKEPFNNVFDKSTITAVGEFMTASYDKAVNDVMAALDKGEDLKPLKSMRDGWTEIRGTGFDKIDRVKNVKLIDSNGVKAFVPNSECGDLRSIKTDAGQIAKVITARANTYMAQDAYEQKDEMSKSAYNLIRSTNFNIYPVDFKRIVNGNVESANLMILSPSIATTFNLTGSNLTRLNNACKYDLEETKNIIGLTVFDKAEEMAKGSVINESRSLEQLRESQNKIIESVKEDVAKVIDNCDKTKVESKMSKIKVEGKVSEIKDDAKSSEVKDVDYDKIELKESVAERLRSKIEKTAETTKDAKSSAYETTVPGE